MLGVPERRRNLAELKRILVDREYFEVVNLSFVDAQWERDFCGNAEPIALENPIAAQLEVMRSSMIGSLVANLRFNLARKLERVRVFEAGRCFLRSSDGEDPGDPAKALPGYYQPLRLAGLAYGPAAAEQWGTPAGRVASVSLDETVIGWIGELHPRWQQKYELPQPAVLFELEAEALTIAATPHYREISKFPPVIRDRAVVVDEGVSARALLEEMDRIRSPLVQDIRLFDVYRGGNLGRGRKSLAFRVVMQDTARTLTDAEADAAMAQLTEGLSAKFGAKLRA